MTTQNTIPPSSKKPPHILTLVLIAGAAAVPMNIFVASLPTIAEYFDTRYQVIQIAITGFLFLTGWTQLIAGPLSDRFGRRPVVLGTFGIFLLASVGCSLAQSTEVFLLFRALQAVIAAGMILSRTIVRDIVGPARAASMIGYVTMGMALAPMLAPPFGGLLASQFGWQSNFYAMIVLGLLAWVVAFKDLGETNTRKSSSMSAQFRQYPELLRSRRLWGYALIAAFSAGNFFAYLGGGPYIAANTYGLNAAQMGIFFSITPLGYVVGNGFTGRFATRLGIPRLIFLGTSITTVMLLIALVVQFAGATHPLAFFAFTFFIGLGNGLSLPSANAGLMSVKPELAGSASGLGGALMVFFGAALSALSVAVIVRFSGAIPLILCILASSIAASITTLYIARRERVVAKKAAAEA
jgi:DHA1 family bicyclomycin/chloramphenicol resistance-like MFS transporter